MSRGEEEGRQGGRDGGMVSEAKAHRTENRKKSIHALSLLSVNVEANRGQMLAARGRHTDPNQRVSLLRAEG